VTEASGLAASKCQPDVFWTHKDSGDDNFIYAINAAAITSEHFVFRTPLTTIGKTLRSSKMRAANVTIYIGDTGNNGKRDAYTIYRVPEPTVSAATRDTKQKKCCRD
jgi:hypothetical protein